MRIACLQFDPQVGDVDNNLNRADDILSKANPDDLDRLDLLVLPELAFTGYNFRSLQHIAPCFEEAGAGISSLWARTTALKHDCTVVVGYPEKVDVSAKWPASPEYYNSALIVNGDGDIVANYRKSFLYYTDETWALEGAEGFFKEKIAGLGNVALGICTDLNPYKLEAPWDAFEFGLHVVKAKANLVIMSMAWQTHQDPNEFMHAPQDPDLETLVYWVQRLEPLIRADKDEEVIVVFCNRTGTEEEVTYTGTSAVLGIKSGEVFVYGVLGRGVNQLLVVDTDQPPRSKLTDADAAAGDSQVPEKIALNTKVDDKHPHRVSDDLLADECGSCQCHLIDSALGHGLDSPRKPTSPRLPWLAQPIGPGGTPTDSRSPTRLQIPTRPPLQDAYSAIDSAITDDILAIPAQPLTPSSAFVRRPLLRSQHLGTPASPWRFPNSNKGTASPYPWHGYAHSSSAVFGGGATMTPITPFDEDGWSSTPIETKGQPGWFWRHEPTLGVLREDVVEEEGEGVESMQVRPPQEGDRGSSTVEPLAVSDFEPEASEKQGRREEAAFRKEPAEKEPETGPLNTDWADLADVLEGLRVRPGSAFDFRLSGDDRPSSPKSRNLSRSASPFGLFQPSELSYGEWESTAWGSLDSGPRHDLVLETVERPDSRAGHGTVQSRSNSFDGTGSLDRNGTRAGRRPPSRLRHAMFFPDEPDDELDPGHGPDQEPIDEINPQIAGRDRQLAPQQTPKQFTDKQHPSPLTMEAVLEIHQAATTTPSLCSATSAASTTSISSPFRDYPDNTPDLVRTGDDGDDIPHGDYPGVTEQQHLAAASFSTSFPAAITGEKWMEEVEGDRGVGDGRDVRVVR